MESLPDLSTDWGDLSLLVDPYDDYIYRDVYEERYLNPALEMTSIPGTHVKEVPGDVEQHRREASPLPRGCKRGREGQRLSNDACRLKEEEEDDDDEVSEENEDAAEKMRSNLSPGAKRRLQR